MDDVTASQFTSTLCHALGAQQGDELSWSRLEAKVRPWIEARLAREALPPTMDADDVLQAVLFELFRSFNRLEISSRDAFRSWVLRVTDHKLTDLWRRARARKRGDGRQVPLDRGDEDSANQDPEDPAAGPSTIVRGRELEARVAAVVEGLPRGDQEILRLREEEGLDYAEIARLWSYEKSETVRKRFFRARQRRRELLESLARDLTGSTLSQGDPRGEGADERSAED